MQEPWLRRVTLFLALSIAAWAGLFAIAYRSPGAGLAIAAVVGQYDFPSRGDAALLPGGPLIAFVTLVGAFVAERDAKRPVDNYLPAVAVSLLVALGAASALARGSTLDEIALQRLTLMLLYVVPLCLIASGLSAQELERFRVWLTRLAVVLGGMSLVAGSVDASGRSVALGGGPIPLAQLSMFGLLLVVLFDDPITPVALSRRGRQTVRAVLGLLFVLVGVQTASRFPLIAVVLAPCLVLLLRRRKTSERMSRVRGVSKAAFFGFVPIALVVAAEASGAFKLNSRFELLEADLGGEFQRSRGDLFQHGLAEAWASMPFGYGPGNFPPITFDGILVLAYPHNIAIEVAGDYGLVGLVVLLLLLRATFFPPIAQVNNTKYLLLATYGFLIAQTSGDLVHNRYLFLFAAIVILTRETSRGNYPGRSNPHKSESGLRATL